MKYISLIFITLISTCSGYSQTKITLGVSAPMTGELHEYGTAVKNGFELAQRTIPLLNEMFNIIYEDNQYTSLQSVSSLKKLIDINHSDIVYLWGELPLFAVHQLIDSMKTPILSMSIDSSSFRDQKYLSRTIPGSEEFINPLCMHLLKKGIRSIDIINTDDPFMNAMAQAAKHCEGITIHSEFSVTSDEMNFSALATKMKSLSPKAIGCFLNSAQAGAFLKHTSILNFSVPVIGTDVFDSATEIESSKGGMEGAVFSIIKVPDEFRKTYIEYFDNDSQLPYAYNAYTTLNFIGEKISLMDSFDKENFQKMIRLQSLKEPIFPTEIELREIRNSKRVILK